MTSLFQDENVSQAITQGGGCLTLHSKWKSAFDDSEASDNETEMKGENLASPEHAKGAGGETANGGGEQQVAATTRALELSRITENTSCKEEGKGESEKKQSLHIDIQLPLPSSSNAKTSSSPEQSKPVVIPPPPKIEPPPPPPDYVPLQHSASAPNFARPPVPLSPGPSPPADGPFTPPPPPQFAPPPPPLAASLQCTNASTSKGDPTDLQTPLMTRTVADMKSAVPGTVVAALTRYHPLQHSASAHSYVGSEYSAAPSPISGQRSTAKSPLLQEAKFLPPDPSPANQSEEPEEDDEEGEEEEDEEEDEEGEEDGDGEQEGAADKDGAGGEEDEEDGEEDEEEERVDDNEYVAAVCQYTTVLKETPPGFDDKKYEVNYMNLEQGAAANNVEPDKAWPSLHVTEKKKDEERRSNFSNERLIEYCDEEEEECNEAVSGKLAIHLDTGETSREFCINRVDDAHSRRSQTREESVTCGSELEKPLFIKKYQGRFFQTDVETSSDKSENEAPPVPPPRSKSKESSVVVGKTDRCCSPGLECNLIYDSVAADPDKVMEATSSTRATDARLPGSFGEGKNVEYLEKKEVKSVESSDRSQSKSSSSDKVKARMGSGGGVYRRLGVVSMPPAPDLGEEAAGKNEGARRISLDDLSDAFRGLNGATKKVHSGASAGCTKGTTTVVYNDYQSDDSILEERADSVTKNCHRRSKSEESLLDRAEARLMKDGTISQSRSRRNSPLSHSSSVHQHLVRGNTPDRCGGVQVAYSRRSQSRDRSLSKDQDGSSHAIKSRIPVPVRSLHDKEDVSSSIGEVLSDSHYVASPEPNSRALDSHHSYVSSRYSDRYQPSTYISSYVPHYSSHEYNPHTTTSSPYTSYRPTSAKDYTSRYNNFYSPAPVDPVESSSFLTSGSTSPRWRRRSYDHDSDYLRYQRRTSRAISDYPAPSSSAATSAALNRSRSRSRVSDYDAYTRREPADSYLSTYSSRPSQSNYLYGHSYSNYHEGGGAGGEVTMVSRQPRPPEYPPQSAEVSARTRRYQPDK